VSEPGTVPSLPERPVGRLVPLATRARPFSWERTLLSLHSWAVFVFLYAPILILIVFSFNKSRQTAIWTGFTFDWYGKLFDNELILRAVRNSLMVAGITTVVATLIGTMVALALARLDFPARGMTQAMLYLPIIIPEIVMGAALVTFFGVVGLRLSIWSVVVAHVTFSISYVAIVVRARLAGFDRSLEEAALDLGATPWMTFWRVTFPITLPGIVAGALLVFTISIDDYVVTSFVAGVGATTLPLQIYSMLKVGVTPEVNAVSTLLLLMTVVLIVVSQRLQQGPSSTGDKK
jgi:spermidine/putrescine transport system permease protein